MAYSSKIRSNSLSIAILPLYENWCYHYFYSYKFCHFGPLVFFLLFFPINDSYIMIFTFLHKSKLNWQYIFLCFSTCFSTFWEHFQGHFCTYLGIGPKGANTLSSHHIWTLIMYFRMSVHMYVRLYERWVFLILFILWHYRCHHYAKELLPW